MNADRWSLIRRLFAEAQELEPEARRAFLETECGGDQILFKEIWELLEEDAEDDFLEAPVIEQISAGVTMGDFELLEELGSGGTGIVFRARQKSLEREVALKVMPRHFALNERRVARFVREAKAAAKLEHPGIAPIFGVGKEGDHHFFAMELISGHDLARELELQHEGGGMCAAKQGSAQFREAARIVMQVADALAFAHSKGIVHRDIKPNNILLDTECRPRLVDFGLAKDESLGSITVTDKVEGTPYYMSPEQAHLVEERVDERTDIYSLGVVLYELLSKSRPFEGRTSQEVLNKIIRREPRPIAQAAPGVPRDLAVICTKAMEKRPGDRYATARALRDDLESFLAGEPIRARPPGLARKAGRLLSRHRAVSGAALAAALALTGANVAEDVWARQAWPVVSIAVASGPEAHVVATPLQAFLGSARGKSIDLGMTPIKGERLEPGRWRFSVVVDADHFAELDRDLEQVQGGEERHELELTAHVPSGRGDALKTVPFEGASMHSRVLERGVDSNPKAAWRDLSLRGYQLGLHEVSFGEFRSYLKESGRPQPLLWAGLDIEAASDDLPVVLLTQEEARDFAEWYGFRLPYEPEWEWAAMGAEGRRYPWGDADEDAEQRANIHADGARGLGHPGQWAEFLSFAEGVETRPDARTPEGLYHMLGNVAEATASGASFSSLPLDLEKEPDSFLSLGGTWFTDRRARYLPAASWFPLYEGTAQHWVGLRVAKSRAPFTAK